MKPINFLLFKLILVATFSTVNAQIVGVGTKLDKQFMFQANVNVPIKFNANNKYDLAFGVDYTTPNSKAPSGLQPQMTGIVYLVDDKSKSNLVYGGLTTGYLFDFNKEFDNQIRITPHIYYEYMSLIYIKAGADYATPINKIYPFISIGIGGGHMFRHFSIGF